MEIRLADDADAAQVAMLIQASLTTLLPPGESRDLLIDYYTREHVEEEIRKRKCYLVCQNGLPLWFVSFAIGAHFTIEKWYGVTSPHGRTAALAALFIAEHEFAASGLEELHARLLAPARAFCDRYPWSGEWSISDPYWHDDDKLIPGRLLRLEVCDCRLQRS
jgi:hypothetical protein